MACHISAPCWGPRQLFKICIDVGVNSLGWPLMLISAKALNQSNQKRTFFFSRPISSHIVSFSFHLQDLQVSSNFGKPGNLGGFREPAHILVHLATTIQLFFPNPLPRSKRKASEQIQLNGTKQGFMD